MNEVRPTPTAKVEPEERGTAARPPNALPPEPVIGHHPPLAYNFYEHIPNYLRPDYAFIDQQTGKAHVAPKLVAGKQRGAALDRLAMQDYDGGRIPEGHVLSAILAQRVYAYNDGQGNNVLRNHFASTIPRFNWHTDLSPFFRELKLSARLRSLGELDSNSPWHTVLDMIPDIARMRDNPHPPQEPPEPGSHGPTGGGGEGTGGGRGGEGGGPGPGGTGGGIVINVRGGRGGNVRQRNVGNAQAASGRARVGNRSFNRTGRGQRRRRRGSTDPQEPTPRGPQQETPSTPRVPLMGPKAPRSGRLTGDDLHRFLGYEPLTREQILEWLAKQLELLHPALPVIPQRPALLRGAIPLGGQVQQSPQEGQRELGDRTPLALPVYPRLAYLINTLNPTHRMTYQEGVLFGRHYASESGPRKALPAPVPVAHSATPNEELHRQLMELMYHRDLSGDGSFRREFKETARKHFPERGLNALASEQPYISFLQQVNTAGPGDRERFRKAALEALLLHPLRTDLQAEPGLRERIRQIIQSPETHAILINGLHNAFLSSRIVTPS